VVWLRLVHIVAGVVWVGSAVFAALFVLPTARVLGAEGGRFVARLMPRSGPVLGGAMLLTIVSGFIMYGRLSAGFNRAWVTSRVGLALGAGAVAALLAVIVGVAVNAPAGAKMARLATLQARVERGAQLVALLLLTAAGAMAVARYL